MNRKMPAPYARESGSKDGSHQAQVREYFELHSTVAQEIPLHSIAQVCDRLILAYQRGRKILVFGNGGSAALAAHLACDLGKGTTVPSSTARRLRVISLTDNTALLTALANDLSFEDVFSEQLANLVDPEDVAFAISGSGNSPNVIEGLRRARALGAFTIGLTGHAGGKMKALCDLSIIIPSENMQIIEDHHVAVMHSIFTVVRNYISNAAESTERALAAGARAQD